MDQLSKEYMEKRKRGRPKKTKEPNENALETKKKVAKKQKKKENPKEKEAEEGEMDNVEENEEKLEEEENLQEGKEEIEEEEGEEKKKKVIKRRGEPREDLSTSMRLSTGPENAKFLREIPCWKIGCNNIVIIFHLLYYICTQKRECNHFFFYF